jgi:hypothetical protein
MWHRLIGYLTVPARGKDYMHIVDLRTPEDKKIKSLTQMENGEGGGAGNSTDGRLRP